MLVASTVETILDDDTMGPLHSFSFSLARWILCGVWCCLRSSLLVFQNFLGRFFVVYFVPN
jgi:hypothetical protein